MRDWRAAALAGIVLRLAMMAATPEGFLRNPQHDPDHYGGFAKCLWQTGTFGRDSEKPIPSAYRPPLYPMMLAPLRPMGVAGIVGLHLAASVLTVWATARLARTACGDPAGPIAGWLVAVDPLLLGQSALLMTETVFVALVAWWLATWCEGKPGRAGLLLGLAALCRPTAWALGLAVMVWKPRAAVKSLLIAALVVAPWAIRNGVRLGTFTPTTTHGGYTLLLGMNPWFQYSEIGLGHVWSSEDPSFAAFVGWHTFGWSEPQADAELRRAAWRWMTAYPDAAFRSAEHHVASLWSPFPRTGHDVLRWAFGTWALSLYLFAGIGACLAFGGTRGTALPPTLTLPPKRGEGASPRRMVLMLLGVPLALTLVHALLWSNIRMRAPAIPVLAVLAALPLSNVKVRRDPPANPA